MAYSQALQVVEVSALDPVLPAVRCTRSRSRFLLGPGSDVGLTSILDGAPHTATVRAIDDLLVSAVPLWAMARVLNGRSEQQAILSHLSLSSMKVRGGWLENPP